MAWFGVKASLPIIQGMIPPGFVGFSSQEQILQIHLLPDLRPLHIFPFYSADGNPSLVTFNQLELPTSIGNILVA